MYRTSKKRLAATGRCTSAAKSRTCCRHTTRSKTRLHAAAGPALQWSASHAQRPQRHAWRPAHVDASPPPAVRTAVRATPATAHVCMSCDQIQLTAAVQVSPAPAARPAATLHMALSRISLTLRRSRLRHSGRVAGLLDDCDAAGRVQPGAASAAVRHGGASLMWLRVSTAAGHVWRIPAAATAAAAPVRLPAPARLRPSALAGQELQLRGGHVPIRARAPTRRRVRRRVHGRDRCWRPARRLSCCTSRTALSAG